METVLLVVLAIAALANLGLLAMLFARAKPVDLGPMLGRLDAIERGAERVERSLREDLARGREEALGRDATLRQELTGAYRHLGDTVEQRLRALQSDNAERLEQMRRTVDEQLQGTLERRIGESFRTVSEWLEKVHKGLGEMQQLADGVGDLKRVLSNVKARGILGEIQLGGLLEEILTPHQYGENVDTRGDGRGRVEFAIRLPGRGDDQKEVWLPIDAKFPQEDYLRLVDAQERGDPAGVAAAGRELEVRIRACAREICDKYIAPPATTEFAILFLPTEGLYAEVVRRIGVVEDIRRDCKVVIAGPSTLAALLNSLQMGFRTLAVQQRSVEVWTILGRVKTEFGKFGDVMEKVRRKLTEASNVVDDVSVRTRAIERRLRAVEALPVEGNGTLALAGGEDEELLETRGDGALTASGEEPGGSLRSG